MVNIWLMMVNDNLVGGAITILKNMKVNGNDYPTYYGKIKKCLKPPSSFYNIYSL
jgi:hypothetical protein